MQLRLTAVLLRMPPPAHARTSGACACAGASRHARRTRLIAPLAVFMLVFFVVPIVMLLGRSAWDPVVAASLPATTQALRGWNGTALPSDAAYAALARDIVQADDAGTLGQVTPG